MNTLGNKDKQNNIKDSTFKLPKTFSHDEEEIPLWKGFLIGVAFHILLPILISLLMLILTFLGLNLSVFKTPDIKPKDIEFVLVNKKEEPPINKKTRHRADRNSRAAGKHDPNKTVAETQASSRPTRQQSSSNPAPKQRTIARQQKKQTTSNNIFKNIAKQFEQAQPKAVKKVAVAPPRPTKPVPETNYTRELAPPRPHSISVPTSSPAKRRIKSSSFNGGPVTSGPIGVSGSSSTPTPITGSGGNGSSKSKGGNPSSYSAGSHGSAGNPDIGGPANGSGIDAIKEPDFGPYMRALQSRIKRNWTPPKGDESKRVVLFFKIAKDGRLLALRVVKTSTSPEADRAALSAVELSAPFRSLPPEYRDNDIDIQFTFDYNVISGYRR